MVISHSGLPNPRLRSVAGGRWPNFFQRLRYVAAAQARIPYGPSQNVILNQKQTKYNPHCASSSNTHHLLWHFSPLRPPFNHHWESCLRQQCGRWLRQRASCKLRLVAHTPPPPPRHSRNSYFRRGQSHRRSPSTRLLVNNGVEGTPTKAQLTPLKLLRRNLASGLSCDGLGAQPMSPSLEASFIRDMASTSRRTRMISSSPIRARRRSSC